MQDELSARTEGKRLDTIPFAIGFLSVFAFIVSAIAFPEPSGKAMLRNANLVRESFPGLCRFLIRMWIGMR